MKKAIYLEIARKGSFLEISLSKGEQTLTHYEESSVSPDELGKRCNELMHLLNMVSRRGTIPPSVIEEMQQMGRVLYNEVFPLSIKSQLYESPSSDMILRIDNNLVHVPWELLFDGQHFLCEKFNIGRMVKTQQIVAKRRETRPKLPLRILIIADPKSDLKESYEEGKKIRDQLKIEDAKVTLITSEVSTDFLKKRLFNYDLIHYAGHADYDLENPSQSGWLLEDGKFTTLDIRKMGGSNPLPWMVFSNACQSGQTEAWKVDEAGEEKIYGLANAFLLSGVQHYIGTFWKVLDEPSTNFALKFYENILNGESVGKSMRSARLALRQRYGEGSNILWASYLLYGDPCVRYFASKEENKEEKLLVGAGIGETSGHRQKAYIERNGLRTRSASENNSNGAYGWRYKDKSASARNYFLKHPIISLGGIILCVLLLFSLINNEPKKGIRVPNVGTQAGYAEEQEFNRLKVLVGSGEASDDEMKDFFQRLVEKYNRERSVDVASKDEWTSRSIALFFATNQKEKGIEAKADARSDFLVHRLMSLLEKDPRIKIVEREYLGTLLKELDLGSSPLADPEYGLKLGQIVAGNLFTLCSVSNLGEKWQVNLRMIESETSMVEAALTEQWKEGADLDQIASSIAENILREIEQAFPLHARIKYFFNDQKIMLNIGSRQGVEEGMQFFVLKKRDILGKDGKPIEQIDVTVATLKVSKVNEEFSYAEVLERVDDLAEGMRASLSEDLQT